MLVNLSYRRHQEKGERCGGKVGRGVARNGWILGMGRKMGWGCGGNVHIGDRERGGGGRGV
jgi:hypothetical protein